MVAVLFNGRHSDRTRERTWHAAVPLAMLSVGVFLLSQLGGHPQLSMLVMIFLVGSCVFTHIPAFWPMPTIFLGATAAASAIGFINMVGNMGGFVGPKIVGDSANIANMATSLRNNRRGRCRSGDSGFDGLGSPLEIAPKAEIAAASYNALLPFLATQMFLRSRLP